MEVNHDWSGMKAAVRLQKVVTIAVPLLFVTTIMLWSGWVAFLTICFVLFAGVRVTSIRCPRKGGPALGRWGTGISDASYCAQCGERAPGIEHSDGAA
ncbi:MAG: hypothetical protein MK135_09865 [Polyangiaceae bacterium]|nr:hypothetical protein [Polyangiaceae bacterium]